MQNDIHVIGATRIPVGLSAIIPIIPTAYQYADCLKIFSGGGTLEIVAPPLALSGSSCVGWGQGYPLGASEVQSIGGPAVMYLAATGATMVVTMMIGRTAGATCITS
jgi:hypothetical protein